MKWPRYIPGRRGGDDHIYQEVMSGMYNRHYTLKLGDVVVDAGAHIGFWTFCYAAEKIGPTGRFVAFEPEPDNYRVLCGHRLEHMETPGVCYKMALWSSNGYMPLHLSGSSAEHSINHDHRQKDARSVDVWAASLDNLWFMKLDFIKIDVEGAEYELLQGAQKTIQKCRPHMGIEIDDTLVGPVRDLLAGWNYDLIQVTPTRQQTVFNAVPK